MALPTRVCRMIQQCKEIDKEENRSISENRTIYHRTKTTCEDIGRTIPRCSMLMALVRRAARATSASATSASSTTQTRPGNGFGRKPYMCLSDYVLILAIDVTTNPNAVIEHLSILRLPPRSSCMSWSWSTPWRKESIPCPPPNPPVMTRLKRNSEIKDERNLIDFYCKYCILTSETCEGGSEPAVCSAVPASSNAVRIHKDLVQFFRQVCILLCMWLLIGKQWLFITVKGYLNNYQN